MYGPIWSSGVGGVGNSTLELALHELELRKEFPSYDDLVSRHAELQVH